MYIQAGTPKGEAPIQSAQFRSIRIRGKNIVFKPRECK